MEGTHRPDQLGNGEHLSLTGDKQSHSALPHLTHLILLRTAQAREEAPDSIRALYGTDQTANAVHGSDGKESAEREIEFFFPGASKGVVACFAQCEG
jgi:hypothetical protein